MDTAMTSSTSYSSTNGKCCSFRSSNNLRQSYRVQAFTNRTSDISCFLTSKKHTVDLNKEHDQTNRISAYSSLSSYANPTRLRTLSSVALILGANHIFPEAGHCSESISGAGLEVFNDFLGQVEALGPWGGLLFVATVSLAEMIPLLPTQPLALASGLLFGAQKGAFLMLLGVTLAALGAFTLSRGVGRPLAQRVIEAEGLGDGKGESSVIASSLASVEAAIQAGGFWRQAGAVMLLRLTPIVPFSASNYLLGIMPLMPSAFLAGTVGGMSIWSVFYASLGGTSRALLGGEVDLEMAMNDLMERAGSYTSNVALACGAVALVAAVVFAASRALPAKEKIGRNSEPALPEPGSHPVDKAQQSKTPLMKMEMKVDEKVLVRK